MNLACNLALTVVRMPLSDVEPEVDWRWRLALETGTEDLIIQHDWGNILRCRELFTIPPALQVLMTAVYCLCKTCFRDNRARALARLNKLSRNQAANHANQNGPGPFTKPAAARRVCFAEAPSAHDGDLELDTTLEDYVVAVLRLPVLNEGELARFIDRSRWR